MSNRLANATSPYLRQHADNPVDWWEWGDDAFREAKRRDVPVLLSVGYAACHWCHVMAHESFEDEATALIMNRDFVNIKVDREERPDVDAVYMEAVQALTGRGGWPMTVWLTPDRRPFFAGTYFPNTDRHGMASFTKVLDSVTTAWNTDRSMLVDQAQRLTESITENLPTGDMPTNAAMVAAYESIVGSADPINGGFGSAPKFPQAPVLEFLLRVADEPWAPQARAVLRQTLIKMARGGIYDHVIGGFARYSVDDQWLIPHFEKMLYDNAQLARIYLRAGQVLGEPSFFTVTEQIFEYMDAHLGQTDGGFYSAQDADSEGEEGKFAVFDRAEFEEIAGSDSAIAAEVFGVTDVGNFEGSNNLYRAKSHAEVAEALGLEQSEVDAAIDQVIDRLREVRANRVPPALDDKVVTAWNGLAIRALAEAGAVLGNLDYLDRARRCARFVLENNIDEKGRLLRSWSAGRATTNGFLEDYAGMSVGLLALYQATGEIEWYRHADALARTMVELFSDDDGGAMFTTGSDSETLISRKKDQMDNPVPSGNSMAAESLMMLSAYQGSENLRVLVEQILEAGSLLIERYPSAVGQLLAVATTFLSGIREVAVVGPDATELGAAVWAGFRPDVVLAMSTDASDPVPLLEGRWAADVTRAFVCRNFVCDLPVTTVDELTAQLSN